MSKAWPRERLGEVLQRVERYEHRNELIEYSFTVTYSFACPEQLIAIEIPIPDLERQQIGEHLFAEIDTFKPLQAETAAELDALLPAILDRAFKGEI